MAGGVVTRDVPKTWDFPSNLWGAQDALDGVHLIAMHASACQGGNGTPNPKHTALYHLPLVKTYAKLAVCCSILSKYEEHVHATWP